MRLRSRRTLAFLTCFTLAALTLQGCSKAPSSTTAKVTGGTVQGSESGKIIAFKGIPYAAPPVGDYRWRSPQPVPKWQGIKQVDHYAPDCMQKPFVDDAAPLATLPAEDCLYLNVIRPAKQSEAGYPVVVWFYGGGFVNGGASAEVYSGDSFAKQGVVFVSFNYRLGRFGFFAHPALSTFENDALGNYAIMDQIAALKWVKNNIAEFGGDPNQVTIMGESAGGKSVHAMLQAPGSQGLFNKAIVMSGGGRELFNLLPLHSDDQQVLSAEQVGINFAAQHQITGSDQSSLKALRELPAQAIVGNLNLSTLKQENDSLVTYSGGPILDGTLITSTNSENLHNGQFSKVPLMVGTTSHDIGNANFASKQALFDSFADNAKQAQVAYDPENNKPLAQLNYQVGQDKLMQEPARFTAQRFSKSGQNAYLYRFAYVAQTLNVKGAAHASEIPYFFNTVATKYGHVTTEQDKQAGKTMHRYVTNFIKTGNPNGPGLINWQPFQQAPKAILELNNSGIAEFVTDPLGLRLNATQAKVKQH